MPNQPHGFDHLAAHVIVSICIRPLQVAQGLLQVFKAHSGVKPIQDSRRRAGQVAGKRNVVATIEKDRYLPVKPDSDGLQESVLAQSLFGIGCSRVGMGVGTGYSRENNFGGDNRETLGAIQRCG